MFGNRGGRANGSGWRGIRAEPAAGRGMTTFVNNGSTAASCRVITRSRFKLGCGRSGDEKLPNSDDVRDGSIADCYGLAEVCLEGRTIRER